MLFSTICWADPYLIETYIAQYAVDRTRTTFLIDRNIYSQVLGLAKGAVVTEKTRYAAGIMAFAHCSTAQIEPALAIYEGAASGARKGWRNDLALFHAVDSISPVNWAALALGVASRFDRKVPRRRLKSDIAANLDPKSKLHSFGFVYPIVLKTAILQRDGGTCDDKMVDLITWIYNCWHFSAPCMLFACRTLCPAPPRRAFKNLMSGDRTKALAGVRNAAWDMTYITEWHKRAKVQSEANELTVICSRDALLSGVTTQLADELFGVSEQDPFSRAGFGKRVLETYHARISDSKNPKRALMPIPDNFEEYRAQLVSDLEAEFLSMRTIPSQG